MDSEDLQYAQYLYQKGMAEQFTSNAYRAWEIFLGPMPTSRDTAWTWLWLSWRSFVHPRYDADTDDNDVPAETLVMAMQLADKFVTQAREGFSNLHLCERWWQLPTFLTSCLWIALKMQPVDTLEPNCGSWVEPDAIFMFNRAQQKLPLLICTLETIGVEHGVDFDEVTTGLRQHFSFRECVRHLPLCPALNWRHLCQYENIIMSSLKGDVATMPASQLMFAALNVLKVKLPEIGVGRSLLLKEIDNVMFLLQSTQTKHTLSTCVHAAVMVLVVRTKLQLPKIELCTLAASCGYDAQADNGRLLSEIKLQLATCIQFLGSKGTHKWNYLLLDGVDDECIDADAATGTTAEQSLDKLTSQCVTTPAHKKPRYT